MSYRIPEHVAYVVVQPEDDDPSTIPTVFVRRLPGGPTLHLADTAALIWLTATEGGIDVVVDVARLADTEPDQIREDVAAFLAHLVDNGVLVADEDPGPDRVCP